MQRPLISETHASSCYFRTSVGGDGRKALIQITERCNLHCAHCFVSSGSQGRDMGYEDLVERVLPRLVRARVERLTLTGGEPFVHPSLLEICSSVAEMGMPLGICTNATQTTDEQIAALQRLGNVHVNVSFDGFSAGSHGKFRGSPSSFAVTVETTRKLAEAGLLHGLLSTPNALSDVDEFDALCEFAVEVGARYVLMNPLSSFGRGVKSQDQLAANGGKMREIRAVTERFRQRGLDLVHIRFPNDDKPLGGCDIGKLVYVFVDGALAVCPYMVFAARTPQSRYSDTGFLVGNILKAEVGPSLEAYTFGEQFNANPSTKCGGCRQNARCGKGCPAAVVARGGDIRDVDTEQCPLPEDPQ